MVMQREEKALEVCVDSLINQVTDIKNSIASFLCKLDHEHEIMNWPSMLDSFALLSSQLSTLLRVLKNDKTPNLHNLALLPLLLSQDRDPDLEKLTEGRVPAFNHEVVPDYLRTKPEPEVESREQHLHNRAVQIMADAAQKQINNMNKITSNLTESITSARNDWESEADSRASTTLTSSLADTNTLISAVTYGKGLKQTRRPDPSPNNPSATSQQQVPSQLSQPSGSTTSVSKAPSSIKTTIKAATNIHPYNR